MTATSHSKIIALGVIAGAHGVHGRVKVKSYTEIAEQIVQYSPLTDKRGEREFRLRITGRIKELLLCEIEGITQREQAEALRGVELCVPRERVPTAADERLIADIIGLAVLLEDGTQYGTVKAFHNYGAGDILEIALSRGGETELVLYNTENFPTISEGSITFRPPEILKAAPPAKEN